MWQAQRCTFYFGVDQKCWHQQLCCKGIRLPFFPREMCIRDSTYDEVESVLRQLFQEQYTLSFSEETEIRYRTETSVDPETGEETQEDRKSVV